MSTAYISIGSNLGEREENCKKATNLIRKNGIAVTKQSKMYETEPWGVKNQPKFINMAIEVETDKRPDELLMLLKQIEKDLGRTETVKWGPRVIDLDILLYNDLVLDTPDLKIPHPHLHEREFVLRPLNEIAFDKKHPETGQTIKEMLKLINRK